MIRSIVFPRILGRSLEELQPVLELFRALGFVRGNEWHESGNHGIEMLAPNGGVEFIAAPDAPSVDLMVEVSDIESAWAITRTLIPSLSPKSSDKSGAPAKLAPALDKSGPAPHDDRAAAKLGDPSGVSTAHLKIQRDLGDTPYGARLFEVEVSGLRVGFIAYAKKPGAAKGIEGWLNAEGKRFAMVVARFNSFITQRLLDGALLALRQSGAKPEDITIVHVPGSFEIPATARQLAESEKYHAIVCIGCVIRGDTLHYEVIANEVTRGVGQSAQDTGVPHAFGVLTCDTLEQAIDRAGLKAGNKGYEVGLAAVEMASLRDKVAAHTSATPEGKG